MKLQDILNIVENSACHSAAANVPHESSGTTSGAVAKYSPVLSGGDKLPIKRMTRKKEANNFSASYDVVNEKGKTCPGCEIIKEKGWTTGTGSKAMKDGKELKCRMCGKSHKKGTK